MYPMVELVLDIAFTKAVYHTGFSLSMEGNDPTMYSFTYHFLKSHVK